MNAPLTPLDKAHIAVVGLGYVGLPLAVELAKKYPTVGYDINSARVDELSKGIDGTLEVENDDLKGVLVQPRDIADGKKGLLVSTAAGELASCHVYIITVPTPTDKHNRPVLTPMLKASEAVGKVLKKGDVVIYESTVYPGVTEEECVPVLEEVSSMRFNEGFYVGYSPERINPGDKEHTVTKILKVTSGSTPEVAEYVDQLYRSVIVAGTHKASSIKVAEAAKVIENSQRDINIAFVNELSKIFNLLGIDTQEVLEAAGTKWNFLKFKPGLVGGHCIGVDPYYLAQKAQEVGYHPEIILAGRRVNDSMSKYVSSELIKLMALKGMIVKGSRILIMGFTFKENCPDIRNTRVIDIYNELISFGVDVQVCDPLANETEVLIEYGIRIIRKPIELYDAVALVVPHNDFLDMDFRSLVQNDGVVYDVKGILPKEIVDGRL